MNNKRELDKGMKIVLKYDQTKASLRIELKNTQQINFTKQNTLNKFGFLMFMFCLFLVGLVCVLFIVD